MEDNNNNPKEKFHGIRKLSVSDTILDPKYPQRLTIESLYSHSFYGSYDGYLFSNCYEVCNIGEASPLGDQVANKIRTIASEANRKRMELSNLLEGNPYKPAPLLHETYAKSQYCGNSQTCLHDCCLDTLGINSDVNNNFFECLCGITIGILTPFSCLFHAIFTTVAYMFISIMDCIYSIIISLLGMGHKISEDERRWFNSIVEENPHLCSFQIDNTVKEKMDALSAYVTSITGRDYYIYTGLVKEEISGDSGHAAKNSDYDVFLIREGIEGQVDANLTDELKTHNMTFQRTLQYPRRINSNINGGDESGQHSYDLVPNNNV